MEEVIKEINDALLFIQRNMGGVNDANAKLLIAEAILLQAKVMAMSTKQV